MTEIRTGVLKRKIITLLLANISLCFSLISGMSKERGWSFIPAAESAQVPLPRLREQGEDFRGNWQFMPYRRWDYQALLAQAQVDPDPVIRERMRRFVQNIQDYRGLVTTTSSSSSTSSSSTTGIKRKQEAAEDKGKEPDEEVEDISEESRPAKVQRRSNDREIEELLKEEMSLYLNKFTEENLRVQTGFDKVGVLEISSLVDLKVPANLIELIEKYFPNVLKLTLDGVRLGAAGFKALTQSKIASQLKVLQIRDCGITAQAFTVENLNKFENLESLAIIQNQIGNGGFEALAQSKIASQLKKLALNRCGITAQGFTAENLNRFEGLESLAVTFNQIGNVGFEALAQSKIAAQLKKLVLVSCEITAQGFTAENLNRFESLKTLEVCGNRLDENAFAALMHSNLCQTLLKIYGLPGASNLLKNNCSNMSR